MSDYESLRAEAREYEAEDRIDRINARRAWQAMQGEPGDPPEYIGEDDDDVVPCQPTGHRIGKRELRQARKRERSSEVDLGTEVNAYVVEQ